MTMPMEKRLGKDKDGIVYVERWQLEVGLAASGFFGDLADEIFQNGAQPWMDPNSRYVHTIEKKSTDKSGKEVVQRIVVPFPKEEDDPEEYFYAKENRKAYVDLQRRFQQQAGKMITFLLNGTMTPETRKIVLGRINTNKCPILADIKKRKDVLLLKKYIEEAWDFKGIKSDPDDLKAARKKFTAFEESFIGHGKSVTEHKTEFDELVRKLISLGGLGNKDPRDDCFKQSEVFDTFTLPLRKHWHKLVRNRIDQYDTHYLKLDKNDPEELLREYEIFQEYEKKPNIDYYSRGDKNNQNNNSVHVTKEETPKGGKNPKKTENGKVNSAQQKVQREVNKQLAKKEHDKKKGPFITEEKFPKSWKKIMKIKEEKKCSIAEAMREFECFECHKYGHLSEECPDCNKNDQPKDKQGKRKRKEEFQQEG